MIRMRHQRLTGFQKIIPPLPRATSHGSHPIPPARPTLTRLMAALPRLSRQPRTSQHTEEVILSHRTTHQLQRILLLQLVMCRPLPHRLSQPRRWRLLIHTVVMDIPILTGQALLQGIRRMSKNRITPQASVPECPIPPQPPQIIGFLQWIMDKAEHLPGIIATSVKPVNYSC